MTKKRGQNGVTMSVCNPDLGWVEGRQFDFRDKDGYQPPIDPVSMPVTLALRGAWKLDMPCGEAQLTSKTTNSTEITVATSDA